MIRNRILLDTPPAGKDRPPIRASLFFFRIAFPGRGTTVALSALSVTCTPDNSPKETKMNTNKGRLFLMVVVAIGVAISAQPFFAQSLRLSADIPFDFYISERLLPAGTYLVEPQQNHEAVRLSDNRGNSMFVMTIGLSPNQSSIPSRLVFHRYGDTSFLASIYWQGYKAGRDLATSKNEKRIAGTGSKPNPVAVQLK
jgi:hypothetical protein